MPTIRCQCSTFVEIEILFLLQETMYNYNKGPQVSPFDPKKLVIHSILRLEEYVIANCGQNFKNTVSFDDIVRTLMKRTT